MVGPRVAVSRETWTGGMIQCREAGVANLLLVWWVTRPSAIFRARFERIPKDISEADTTVRAMPWQESET
jgi:hypothetical protein